MVKEKILIKFDKFECIKNTFKNMLRKYECFSLLSKTLDPSIQ